MTNMGHAKGSSDLAHALRICSQAVLMIWRIIDSEQTRSLKNFIEYINKNLSAGLLYVDAPPNIPPKISFVLFS